MHSPPPLYERPSLVELPGRMISSAPAPISPPHQESSKAQLQRLPLELRQEIYNHVLRDRLIHVSQNDIRAVPCTEYLDSDGVLATPSNNLRFKTCSSLVSEADAYDFSRTLDEDDLYGLSPDIPVGRHRYDERHIDCWRDLRSSVFDHDTAALLCVSKTTYTEVSPVLWAAVTFFFDSGHTFVDFVERLAPWQRTAITSLHFHVSSDDPCHPWSLESDDIPAALATLISLKSLQFNLYLLPYAPPPMNMRMDHVLAFWNNDLMKFRKVCKKRVIIVIEDDYRKATSHWDTFALMKWEYKGWVLKKRGYWTLGDRAGFARALEERLRCSKP
ncbi:MAG: hypothetical protein ASARMPREDX12_001879 [Alectoria sarmentosa]|nr:MAG: hypothetical protein ASARMPREDX12_001879 [Alectoria sarmentosa]